MMKNNRNFAVRAIVFVILAGLMLGLICKVVTPKYYFDDEWPTTTTYQSFYDMERDSIDVLFLGTSHAASAFIPQYIYDNYGIRSYNLACEQQSLFTSYYWLKEALKYQSPTVVVLDTYLIFDYEEGVALNSPESRTRKAFDAMKWSANKWEAVNKICEYDTEQSLLSYILPNVRYHERWKDLDANDLNFLSMENHADLMGYSPIETKSEYTGFVPFSTDPSDADYSDEREPMQEVMAEYLDKIADLCLENDIELILVKNPFGEQTVMRYNTTMDYAEAHGLEYIDFNEKEIYAKLGLDFATEMADGDHANLWGAMKLSDYIGSYLAGIYPDLAGHTGDADWTDTEEYYQQVVADCELERTVSLVDYINSINQPRYSVLITTSGGDFDAMDPELRNYFTAMGLNLGSVYSDTTAYCAVNDQGLAAESYADGTAVMTGSIAGKTIDYTITSSVSDGCSIMIGGEEYATQMEGINIVVYSNERKKVIDSVYFNGTAVIH